MIRLCAINDEISDSFKDTLITLNNLDINYIEIRKIDNKMFHELSNDEINKVISLLNKYNIKVSVLDSSIGKKIIDDIDIFNKYISLSKKIKASSIRIFSDLSDKYLIKINEISKQNNIMLLMENEPNTKFETFDYFYELKERLNLDNIYICYDNENNYKCNNEKIEELKYVKHIHLRDYKDNYDYILEGNLEIDKLLNKLIEEEYEGLISIESHLPMVKKDNKVEMFNRSVNNIKSKYIIDSYLDSIPYTTNVLSNKDILIAVHGLSSNRYGQIKLIDHLNKINCSYVSFDLPNHGLNKNELTLEEALNELDKIINKYKDYNIHLLGTSLGSLLILIYLNKYPNTFKNEILKCPPIDFSDNIVKENEEQYSKYNEIKINDVIITNNFIDEISKSNIDISDSNILVLYGDKDEHVNKDIVYNYCRKNNINNILFDNCDHRFSNNQKELIETIISNIKDD